MGEQTAIAWTDHTFNPWWGCTRISPGCENCYAETWDRRWGESHWGAQAPRRFFDGAHWDEPRKWNRAAEAAGRRARVFCASMADVFEDRRDLDAQRARLWDLIHETPSLDWQLLTKRPENMVRLAPPSWAQRWPANVWAGTTVEDQRRAEERVPRLLEVPAEVLFLSCEPLLEAVDLRIALGGNVRWDSTGREVSRDSIGWVIGGGESGPGARPFELEWGLSLLQQCSAAAVPAFLKQVGSNPVHRGSPWRCTGKGGDPAEWPSDLRVRQFPARKAAH